MKNKTTAALLAFFLGWLGIHRFYLGQGGLGILYFFTLGLFGFGALIDFIVFLTMSEPNFDLKYNRAYLPSTQPVIINKMNPTKIADELKKLHELKESGIISDLEFEAQKEKLLT
jgi:TM2 domain-containing membrane protein YozV